MEIEIIKQDKETEAERLGRMVRYLRSLTGMKREDFANYLNIPLGLLLLFLKIPCYDTASMLLRYLCCR